MHSPGEIQRHKYSLTHRQRGDGAAFVSGCQPGLAAEGTALAVPRSLSHSQSSPNTVQVLWSCGLSPKPPLNWAQIFPIKSFFFFQLPKEANPLPWNCVCLELLGDFVLVGSDKWTFPPFYWNLPFCNASHYTLN